MNMQSVCLVHSPCEHENNSCICDYCQDSPCSFILKYARTDTRTSRTIHVDRPRSPSTTVGENNQQTRNRNLYCTETLLDTPIQEVQPTNHISPTNRRNKTSDQTNTQRRIRTRTFDQAYFQFPAVGTKQFQYHYNLLDKYIFTKYQKTYMDEYTTNPLKLQSGENITSTLYIRRRNSNIQNNNNRRLHQSNNDEQTITTNDTTDGNCITTVECTLINNNKSHIREQEQTPTTKKDISNNTNTINIMARNKADQQEKKNDQQPGTSGTNNTDITDGSAVESNNETTRDNDRTLHTCIIHKSNCGPNYKSYNNKRKRHPDFIEFDHGDHFHILFTTNTTAGNKTRSRNRIATYYQAGNAGITEILITTQTVKHTRAFIQYLIRYGIRSMRKVGAHNETLENALKTITNGLNTDESIQQVINDSKCEQYIEEKKKHDKWEK